MSVRHQFLHRLRRNRRVHHEQQADPANESQRLDVLDRIEGKVLRKGRIRGVRTRDQTNGVTVRRGSDQRFSPDQCAGTAAVFDDSRLAERFREMLRQEPAEQVGGSSRRKRHNQPHGAGRCPLLGLRRSAAEHHRCKRVRSQQRTERPARQCLVRAISSGTQSDRPRLYFHHFPPCSYFLRRQTLSADNYRTLPADIRSPTPCGCRPMRRAERMLATPAALRNIAFPGSRECFERRNSDHSRFMRAPQLGICGAPCFL
jgi:hypothetical protein